MLLLDRHRFSILLLLLVFRFFLKSIAAAFGLDVVRTLNDRHRVELWLVAFFFFSFLSIIFSYCTNFGMRYNLRGSRPLLLTPSLKGRDILHVFLIVLSTFFNQEDLGKKEVESFLKLYLIASRPW